ncbi:hypothetical protein Q9L58_006243 [Maublancomyces gigas]|uniref:Carboxylic ester hydrolase n=1 Tax=Discina gigas TaxID=1032678 RepID=A0ABR3GGA4_9PEZI
MFVHCILLPLALSSISGAFALPTQTPPETLPTVDLGYGVYRASYYNETNDAYVFSNIRFAAPPTGDLRFSLPQPPPVDRSKVHDGSDGGPGCPAALPGTPVLPPGNDSPQSEDCLFLDVIVPRKVLSGELSKVPVAFWVFGGGYTMGSKNSMGDPSILLQASPSPVIWVAINYRLGHFGFLGGPTLVLAPGTVPNAGLHDQRFGLQWVQENIHLFGGDKDEVTIIGASAGAGSTLHQVTAYGGEGEPAMFKRVLPMGPGFFPLGGHSQIQEEYETFEAAAGCASKGVSCLRAATTEALMKANKDIITALLPPRTGPGPSVDGNFVPDLPSYLLAQGRFHKNITVLVLDDSEEGTIFVDPTSTRTAEEGIDDIFPSITATTRSQLLAFYPPPDNTTGYTTEIARFARMIADVAFDHNRYAISAALPDRTYNVVTPGVHGTGATVVFGLDVAAQEGYAASVVGEMRRFVMRFVVSGDPNEVGKGVAEGVTWPVYAGGMGLMVDGAGMEVVDMTGRDEVWKWWTKGLLLS